jgi:hypothetical protein
MIMSEPGLVPITAFIKSNSAAENSPRTGGVVDGTVSCRVVQDWVGHKNIQNTTKYAQLTNPRRNDEARKLFASQYVV